MKKVIIGTYIAVACFTFGSAYNVTIKAYPPTKDTEEAAEVIAIISAAIDSAAWPLYWSYYFWR
jgi:hypothetical protein